ncbi:MAG TPA: VCBS domain-containing protein, partial [Aestuariivirgaceae bacterium]|nr:VCBS domain-containing protein [Aestuariivirgaceae bacterium]
APVDETSLVEQTDTEPLNATIAVTFTDVDLNNVGHAAAVVDVVVSGEDGGLTLNKAALMALVSPGTVIKNAGDSNGSVDVFFTAAFGDFDYLAEGEIVTLTYTIEIDDGDGGTTLQTFDVTITGTNDVPVISGASTGSVTEDAHPTTLTTGGVLTIVDPDAGQSSFVPQTNVAGAYGSFTLLADGTWSYTADNTQTAIQQLGEGDTLTDSFTAWSFDGTASQTVTVTIHGTNDVPVISVKQGDSDEAVLTADEATPTSFLMDIDSGDPIYTSGQMATVTFFISREEGQPPEEVTVEFLMGPSHVETLANLIAAINAADNGLSALKSGNAYQFTLFVDGGALGIDDLSAVFTNPHIEGQNQFDLGVVEVIEAGTNAEGLSASGTLSVGDVDVGDEVDASVVNTLTIGGTGDYSLPSGLDTVAFLAMMSVGTNPVIGSSDTTGQIAWTFDSGDETFGFLDPNETLILIYTIAATDSTGAVTEHEVTITIYGAGSDPQPTASSSDLEFSSALMTSTETIDDDSGEVFVLTETDLAMDDVIIDYQEGDVIDLTQLGFELATGQLNADAAAEYVAYDQATGVLWIDMDGDGREAEFEAAAEFVTPPESIIVRLAAGDTTADIQIA